MQQKINYSSRDFNSTRNDVIDIIKQNYPSILNDFNDASIGSVFIDLNSAVSDMLSYHTDRMAQETLIDFAQERGSVLSIARNKGVKIPGKRPSVTLLDISVKVPVNGDSFDLNYAPFIKRGAQFTGNGFVFEVDEDVDFSQPFGLGGIPNRLIIPNLDSSNTIISYTLTKRAIVKNGYTKIFKRVVTIDDAKPFTKITLPETNILSIDSIILKEGTSYSTSPNEDEFWNDDIRWYEVDALAQNKVFVGNGTKNENNIEHGYWKEVGNRFITEYTNKGYLQITFGSGQTESFTDYLDGDAKLLTNVINNMVNTNSLGNKLKANTTMYIKYKVGGGETSNIGPNVITKVTSVNMVVSGPNELFNESVKSSLSVNNPIPAIGGKNEPSVDEIRALIKYYEKSKHRAVDLGDYTALIGLMDGRFGTPFRYCVTEGSNKINVYVLSLTSAGKLSNTSSSELKGNISEYLANMKMINDYISVSDGKIYNISVDVDIMVDRMANNSTVINNVIKAVSDFFDVNKYRMGENIFLGNLMRNLNNMNGVMNVGAINITNLNGSGYSNNINPYTGVDNKIKVGSDNILYNDLKGMFEIKNPSKEIRVRVK